ncbi:MAG TPA: hypothetical protein VEU76_01040, partial [Candidatus Udaeobacter sp.]|nr:hypothetical protein [Candidatus Udaeobacter sp.]
ELDAMFDAAEDRRFKPLGQRSAAIAPPAPAGGDGATYAVSALIEPEPGVTGDPKVLEALTQRGFGVEQVDGSARMRISRRHVPAKSVAEARKSALEEIRGLIPKKGYRLSDPQAAVEEGEKEKVPVGAGER